jgi:hypothetical protein
MKPADLKFGHYKCQRMDTRGENKARLRRAEMDGRSKVRPLQDFSFHGEAGQALAIHGVLRHASELFGQACRRVLLR